jgi:hypothetical protein
METIILISGPEGVGKSTMINLLKVTCKLKRVICLTGYIRSTSIPVWLIKKILVMAGRRDLAYTPILQKPVIDADPTIINRLINLFIIIDIITLSLKVMLYKTLMIFISKIYRRRVVILFERYALDTVVDLINIKKNYKPNEKVFLIAVDLFLRYNQYVDHILILDANLEVLTRRPVQQEERSFRKNH